MVLLTPAEVSPSASRAPRDRERARRVGRGQLPDGEHDDGSPRPEAKDEGPRPAGQGEETNPRPAPDAATAETTAEEREARRPASGTEGPRPDYQATEAPVARAPATPEIVQTEADAPGVKT